MCGEEMGFEGHNGLKLAENAKKTGNFGSAQSLEPQDFLFYEVKAAAQSSKVLTIAWAARSR